MPSAKPTIGVDDLQTLFPEIAKQADGWDPCSLKSKSSKKMQWRCEVGHTWYSRVADRTPPANQGCPYCAGRLLQGFNDLKTLFPELSKEAYGWDPATVTIKHCERKDWICPINPNHKWTAFVSSRTPPQSRGCPYCSGLRVTQGVNDLLTRNPEIAREAEGWDPSKVSPRSNRKLKWRCIKSHSWITSPDKRVGPPSQGCPYCSGKRLLKGFNDLSTLFPKVAIEADGWDPSTVTYGSKAKKSWKCAKGHKWSAQVNSRTPPTSSGCPECCERGYNPGELGWFYLMERDGEQQFGITNNLKKRIGYHSRYGWWLIESVGPASGYDIQKVESDLKRWLRREIGVIEGTSENWATTAMEVHSLAELKIRSGIETDLF
jgi:hypothetical protein